MSRPDRTPDQIKTANEQIAECIALARRILKEATEIADANGVIFRWPGPERADTMGGRYIPNRDWMSSAEASEGGGYQHTGWNSSSSEC